MKIWHRTCHAVMSFLSWVGSFEHSFSFIKKRLHWARWSRSVPQGHGIFPCTISYSINSWTVWTRSIDKAKRRIHFSLPPSTNRLIPGILYFFPCVKIVFSAPQTEKWGFSRPARTSLLLFSSLSLPSFHSSPHSLFIPVWTRINFMLCCLLTPPSYLPPPHFYVFLSSLLFSCT